MKSALWIVAVGAALVVSVAAPSPSQAVVYCKTVGVPKGCVVRPGAPVVVAPGVGAPGGVVAPGGGGNARGPVNRRGVR
jgi:hypothetical protein